MPSSSQPKDRGELDLLEEARDFLRECAVVLLVAAGASVNSAQSWQDP